MLFDVTILMAAPWLADTVLLGTLALGNGALFVDWADNVRALNRARLAELMDRLGRRR